MTAIIITLIIAATIIYTVSKGSFTITVKNITTTEVGESMLAYQKNMQTMANPSTETPKTEELPTLDDVASIIRQIVDGGEELD
jgi:hypothetical protein